MHGVHHDHPNDPMRLVMPPSVSVPLSALFYLAFYFVLGSTYALAFGAGFLGGYLLYDMTHYHLHHHTPQDARRQAPARAAHAPPLPGRHARLRRQRAVVGPRRSAPPRAAGAAAEPRAER